ncbi:MAG: glycosyltransferase [Desulfobulbaceae bacterium]|nr:glycosyltransferase [Desulfobulbaceae bacterium]
MHRSGTSVITRSLPLLGVNLGYNLNPANHENPKGFWEDLQCLEINEALLHHLGSGWDKLTPELIDPQNDTFITELKRKAIRVVTENLVKNDGIWGFKDPRTCRLLFFWKKVLAAIECDVCYIIALRNPLSVAASLLRRDPLLKEKSLFLWLQHIVSAINATNGEKRTIVDFDTLLNLPLEQLNRIASRLGFSPPDPKADNVKEFLSFFLDNKLRHTNYHPNFLDSETEIPDDVKFAYQTLYRLSQDEEHDDNEQIISLFQKISFRLTDNTYLFTQLDKNHDLLLKVHNLNTHVDNLSKTINHQNVRIKELTIHANNLNEKVKSHTIRNNDLTKINSDLTKIINDFTKIINRLTENINKYELITQKKNQRLHDLSLEVSERDKTISTLSTKISFYCESIKLKNELIQDIFQSKSWRLTAPLRKIVNYTKKVKSGHHHTPSAVPPSHIKEPIQLTKTPNNIPESKIELYDSSAFNQNFYLEAYPDIQQVQEPYAHYLNHGKKEGRLPLPPTLFNTNDLDCLDPNKETVLIIGHEASRSGAPILTLNIAELLRQKYNVIGLPLKGGDLLPYFYEICDVTLKPFNHSFNPNVVSAVLKPFLSSITIKFAIVNSIVSKSVLPVLSHHFIPTVCLIHEFASYTRPNNAIREVLLWSDFPVFSAQIVYENNTSQCPELENDEVPILPQGRCNIPGEIEKDYSDSQNNNINAMLRPEPLPDDTVIILGAGYVHIRKGVDIFLACAGRVASLQPTKKFRFVWIGQGYNPQADMAYSVYLNDQIHRAGLEELVHFADETPDINAIYRLSNIMLLSSRLDPLPNVAIDAMCEGLPVICFDKTTGIADFLKEEGFGDSCVVPYFNIEMAAHRLVDLINNTEQCLQLGLKIKKSASTRFDMASYVESLENLALNRITMQEAERADCRLIEEKQGILTDYYLPRTRSYLLPAHATISYQKVVRFFVRSWKTGIHLRKPFPGFHPSIYSDYHNLKTKGSNPLAHFIQSGKPDGPWLANIITSDPDEKPLAKESLKAALHIHAYFVDLLPDILRCLDTVNSQIDLLISVSSKETNEQLNEILKEYSFNFVDIRLVPNRGRDIGPLLTEFKDTILTKYDVIGHIHTKKSNDVKDSSMGKTWFNFLLENLLGANFSMGKTILNRFASDDKLGLVYPDDPHIFGWTENNSIAKELAQELKVSELPERFFNFPLGTMFWAKTKAIKPLFTHGFSWDDYPEEPLPYDGTILHAIERLIPSVAKSTGYKEALTNVPGVTR